MPGAQMLADGCLDLGGYLGAAQLLPLLAHAIEMSDRAAAPHTRQRGPYRPPVGCPHGEHLVRRTASTRLWVVRCDNVSQREARLSLCLGPIQRERYDGSRLCAAT
jgi:hypothetical protein